jgi:hypothetical protein
MQLRQLRRSSRVRRDGRAAARRRRCARVRRVQRCVLRRGRGNTPRRRLRHNVGRGWRQRGDRRSLRRDARWRCRRQCGGSGRSAVERAKSWCRRARTRGWGHCHAAIGWRRGRSSCACLLPPKLVQLQRAAHVARVRRNTKHEIRDATPRRSSAQAQLHACTRRARAFRLPAARWSSMDSMAALRGAAPHYCSSTNFRVGRRVVSSGVVR